MVGEQVVCDLGLIDPCCVAGLQRPGGDDRLGGEATGEQGLADALAGHHVGGHRGVAGEQHPPGRQRCVVDAGGDRPRRVSILDLESVAERVDDVRPGQQVDPQLLHVLHSTRAVAQHAEADVHTAAGQRERPRVAGHQVRLEPHVQLL